MHFSEKLQHLVTSKNSCLMLGLDPIESKLPSRFPFTPEGVFEFCKEQIDTCHDLVCGIKIQIAHFEVFGSAGIKVVEDLLAILKQKEVFTMIDAKRGDIGSTAESYAKAYLDPKSPLFCDALTINPFLGTDSITPFLEQSKAIKNSVGIFVLARTSNPSAPEFQGGEFEMSRRIAEKIDEWNLGMQSEENFFSNIGAVVGATLPKDFLSFFRKELPHTWFLCPGVGPQGGNLEDVLSLQDDNLGVLIPLSRSILYAGETASDSREALIEYWEKQKK